MKQKYEYGLWLNDKEAMRSQGTSGLVYIKTGAKGNEYRITYGKIKKRIAASEWQEVPGDGLLPGDRVELTNSPDTSLPPELLYIARMEWHKKSKKIKYQLRHKMRPKEKWHKREALKIPEAPVIAPENPELQSILQGNPNDEAAWSVYSDWLLSQEDPMGETIALEIAHRKNPDDRNISSRRNELRRKHRPERKGELLEWATEAPYSKSMLQLVWFYGHIKKAIIKGREHETAPSIKEVYDNLLDSPLTKFLMELIIYPKLLDPNPYNGHINNIIKRDTLKSLRSLLLEAPYRHHLETNVNQIQKLLSHLPNLEQLEIPGPCILEHPPAHENLNSLSLRISDKQQGSSLTNLANCNLPELETLKLKLSFYRSETSPEPNTFLEKPTSMPRLKHLSVEATNPEDYLPESVLFSPLIHQLESLTIVTQDYPGRIAGIINSNQSTFAQLKKLQIQNDTIAGSEKRKLQKIFGDAIEFSSPTYD